MSFATMCNLMFISMKICFAIFKIWLKPLASLWVCSVIRLCEYTLNYKFCSCNSFYGLLDLMILYNFNSISVTCKMPISSK